MKGQVTYEEIRSVDPDRFQDLEATMRLLYDHKSNLGESINWPVQETQLSLLTARKSLKTTQKKIMMLKRKRSVKKIKADAPKVLKRTYTKRINQAETTNETQAPIA